MEFIAEPLILIMDVRRALERGSSTRRGLETFIVRGLKLSKKIKKWLKARDEGQVNILDELLLSENQQIVFELLERGLQGVSIYNQILSIEAEFIEVCEDDIIKHINKLPLKLLVPLFCFIFPGFALLLIGPLLTAFFS